MGARGIDYDPIHNRLWVVGVNAKPNVFSSTLVPGAAYNGNIFAMYSLDFGVTWSQEIQVSNDLTEGRGLPSLRCNQTTGDVAFFWYDARDQSNQQCVIPYVAVIPYQ